MRALRPDNTGSHRRDALLTWEDHFFYLVARDKSLFCVFGQALNHLLMRLSSSAQVLMMSAKLG